MVNIASKEKGGEEEVEKETSKPVKKKISTGYTSISSTSTAGSYFT